MNAGCIRAIVEKEFDEIMKNRLVWMSIVSAPISFSVIMTLAVVVPLLMPADMLSSLATSLDIPDATTMISIDEGKAAKGSLAGFLSVNMFPLVIFIPMMLPMIISTYGIIGEKTGRTLEPLLTAPVSVYDILVGKVLATMLPSVVATWMATTIPLATIAIATEAILGEAIVPDLTAMSVMLLFVAPLCAFMCTLAGIIISSRVNDPRVAQQAGVFIFFPFTIFAILGGAGILSFFDLRVQLTLIILVSAIDVILLYFGNRLFDRENILTRWK